MDWEASPLLDGDSRVEIALTNNTCLAKLFDIKNNPKTSKYHLYVYLYAYIGVKTPNDDFLLSRWVARCAFDMA